MVTCTYSPPEKETVMRPFVTFAAVWLERSVNVSSLTATAAVHALSVFRCIFIRIRFIHTHKHAREKKNKLRPSLQVNILKSIILRVLCLSDGRALGCVRVLFGYVSFSFVRVECVNIDYATAQFCSSVRVLVVEIVLTFIDRIDRIDAQSN